MGGCGGLKRGGGVSRGVAQTLLKMFLIFFEKIKMENFPPNLSDI
jgi:hypothetical protein